MFVWERSKTIEERETEEMDLNEILPQLKQLRVDESVPIYQTNVVFLVPKIEGDFIGKQYLYSILDKRPKKAKVYWFINVEVTDEPYTREFKVDMMETDFLVKVKLYLGFRVHQEVNVYIRQIIQELMSDGRLAKQPQRYSIIPGREVGDFQFILIQESLSNNTELTKWERQILQTKLFIKRYTTSPENWFGLENSDIKYETVPLVIGKMKRLKLRERK